jgi:hypothetical protein
MMLRALLGSRLGLARVKILQWREPSEATVTWFWVKWKSLVVRVADPSICWIFEYFFVLVGAVFCGRVRLFVGMWPFISGWL